LYREAQKNNPFVLGNDVSQKFCIKQSVTCWKYRHL